MANPLMYIILLGVMFLPPQSYFILWQFRIKFTLFYDFHDKLLKMNRYQVEIDNIIHIPHGCGCGLGPYTYYMLIIQRASIT